MFDKDGSEIAVVALPGRADMLVFLPNLVAKRWTSGTTDFLGYVYKGIEEELRKFEADWATRPGNNPPLQRTAAAGNLSWFQRLIGRGRGC